MREERIAKISLALLMAATVVLLGVAAVGRFARAGEGKNNALAQPSDNDLLSQGVGDDGKKAPTPGPGKGTESKTDDKSESATVPPARQSLIASLTIFVLAVFVGFELITKVPPTLHTPLMSGSNAISGITIVGAIFVAGVSGAPFAGFIGFIAVIMATVNCVGGFLVTHRMLVMFAKPR